MDIELYSYRNKIAVIPLNSSGGWLLSGNPLLNANGKDGFIASCGNYAIESRFINIGYHHSLTYCTLLSVRKKQELQVPKLNRTQKSIIQSIEEYKSLCFNLLKVQGS